MRLCETSSRRAFTLIELLVVIGIIAVLVGILLPVITGVMARGRDLKCQSNLRSIIQAMHGYAAENNGAMPWGSMYHHTYGQLGPDGFSTWATLINQYVNRHNTGIRLTSQTGFAGQIPAIAQCPEADLWEEHVVSYVVNVLVCVSLAYEFSSEPEGYRGTLRRPTRLNQLLPETAVVWDTGIFDDWRMHPQTRIGFDIDEQRMARGNVVPQFRFFSHRDIWANVPPGVYGQNEPIRFNVAGKIFKNRDPGSIASHGGFQWPYQGNLRFRHQKETTCNVGFSDGSVRKFTAKMNRDKTVQSHDALRRYFMIKWPTGVAPHPDYPH